MTEIFQDASLLTQRGESACGSNFSPGRVREALALSYPAAT